MSLLLSDGTLVAIRRTLMRSQQKVLFVDENGNVLSAYRISLAGEGYKPVICSSVADALRKMNRQRIDIMVSEISFDGLTELGFALLTNIRSKFPHLPIVVVTQPLDNKMEQKLKSIGVDGLLSKPVDLKVLKRKIKSLIHA